VIDWADLNHGVDLLVAMLAQLDGNTVTELTRF
jgi:hypothetical protein